jgi:hypothetical protein
MAVRSYNGRELLVNPNMVGTGSTSSNSAWIGSSALGWHTAQTTSGNVNLASYTSFQGFNVIKLNVINLTRTGASLGSVAITNLDQYPASTIPVSSLNSYAAKVQPLRQYKYTTETYIESLTATTGGTVVTTVYTFYDINGTRLNGANISSSTSTGAWNTSTVTVTTPANAAYVVLRVAVSAQVDPTTGGTGVVYVRKFSLTEVITRTLTTSRTLATNRVLTRDMGTALKFGVATSDQVTVSNAANRVTSGGGDLTVALWVKPTAFGDFYAFAHPDSALANRTYIAVNIAGSVILNLGATGPSIPNKTRLNQWYHWCLVKDRANSLAYFYINGVSAMSPFAYTPGSLSTPVDIFIGQQSLAGAKAWNGYIDEPRIWNRALTATEVANMYFNNAIPRNGLVGEWLFNETTGTTALDSSGNGNNGVITSATYTTDTPLRARNLV